jgi:hypothetical protein
MSGFENMNSTYTQLLHPQTDANDKYDPTFIGITRKRRVEAPEPVSAFLSYRGKQIDSTHMAHDTKCLEQHDMMSRPDTFKGKVQTTRFGTGFARRTRAAMGVDDLRKQDVERIEHRRVAVMDSRRARTHEQQRATKRTDGSSQIFDPMPTVGATAPKLSGSRTAAVNAAHSTVFSAPERNPTQQQVARLNRITNEGLAEKSRGQWSVKQQMACCDGYVLPRIQEQRPARKHQH